LSEAKKALKQFFNMDYKLLPAQIIEMAFLRLSQIELAQSNFEECLYYSHKCLLLNPCNALAMYLAGIARLYLGELRTAYEIFQHIDENYSDDFFDKKDLSTLINICTQVSAYQMA